MASFFLICIPLISFCCLIALPRTSSTILNSYRENEHCLPVWCQLLWYDAAKFPDQMPSRCLWHIFGLPNLQGNQVNIPLLFIDYHIEVVCDRTIKWTKTRTKLRTLFRCKLLSNCDHRSSSYPNRKQCIWFLICAAKVNKIIFFPAHSLYE